MPSATPSSPYAAALSRMSSYDAASTGPAPKVSCLMVTADRLDLSRRSILCYRRQTYPNKELVIVDDGQVDMAPLLSELSPEEVRYIRLEKREENVLGRLRNVALDAARGDLVAQWDDDDWYHPQRLETQVAAILAGHDACTLGGTLMHLDTDAYFHHPYVGTLRDGVPGSILHRRDQSVRYPEMRRSEDKLYLQAWIERKHARLPVDNSHLFIRCFHGTNTWESDHFLTRMRNTPIDLLSYAWNRYVRRDLFRHRRFRLSQAAKRSFEMYLEDSYNLGLLTPRPR
jgi:glycosyltransferase involved in cell wall biosynthesis